MCEWQPYPPGVGIKSAAFERRCNVYQYAIYAAFLIAIYSGASGEAKHNGGSCLFDTYNATWVG
jgi:hypothetical protein